MQAMEANLHYPSITSLAALWVQLWAEEPASLSVAALPLVRHS